MRLYRQGINPWKMKEAVAMLEAGGNTRSVAACFQTTEEWVAENVPGAGPVEPVDPLAAVIVADPMEGPNPLTVALDGTGSTGDPVKYTWSFKSSGNVFGDEAISECSIHVVGTTVVLLTVEDAEGNEAQAEVSLVTTAATP